CILTPSLRASEPPSLRASEPPSLRASEPLSLRASAPLRLCALQPLDVLHDRLRREQTRKAGQPAPWMRAGTGEIQPVDRRAVLRPAEKRSGDPRLIERRLAVEDVSPGESPRCLEIFGREHLTRRHGLRQPAKQRPRAGK